MCILKNSWNLYTVSQYNLAWIFEKHIFIYLSYIEAERSFVSWWTPKMASAASTGPGRCLEWGPVRSPQCCLGHLALLSKGVGDCICYSTGASPYHELSWDYLVGTDFRFLRKDLYIWRKEKTKMQANWYLLSAGSLPIRPLHWDRATPKVGACHSFQVCHDVCSLAPLLSTQVVSRKLDQKQNGWDLCRHSSVGCQHCKEWLNWLYLNAGSLNYFCTHANLILFSLNVLKFTKFEVIKMT